MADTISIDSSEAYPLKSPCLVDELADLIRQARAEKNGLYPVGGRTGIDQGLPPLKAGCAVDMSAMNQILDYPARDMTVTVEAGLKLADLQKNLAEEGQRLPINPPRPEQSTVGGMIAANRSGCRRYGYGTVRDYIIGINFMTDEGIEVKAGGQVVKNVAGYDLMKMQAGAFGTLGVITKVTFKVLPIPEDQAIVALGLNASAVGPTLDRIHQTATRPVSVELLNTAATKRLLSQSNSQLPQNDPWLLLVGFEEKQLTIDWQLRTFGEELKSAPLRESATLRGQECEPVWLNLSELHRLDADRFILKASVRPSRVAELAQVWGESHPEAEVHAHAGNGIVYLSIPTAEMRLPDASSAIAKVGATLPVGEFHLIIPSCPREWKIQLPVWGKPGSDASVMRRLKATLDPDKLFNPGRLFAEL